MSWEDDGWGEETAPAARTYTDAEAAVDLATYHKLKHTVSAWTLLVVAVLGLVALRWLPIPALALVTGGVAGILNALLLMRGGERAVETRSTGGFVLSSFLRIGLFGIVPVAFAAKGPWWSMAWYFAGFFLPLVLFALFYHRKVIGRTR